MYKTYNESIIDIQYSFSIWRFHCQQNILKYLVIIVNKINNSDVFLQTCSGMFIQLNNYVAPLRILVTSGALLNALLHYITLHYITLHMFQVDPSLSWYIARRKITIMEGTERCKLHHLITTMLFMLYVILCNMWNVMQMKTKTC